MAPNRPVSGLSTSDAATTSTPASAARAGATSTDVSSPSRREPASSGAEPVAPRAASSPAPPSLVPLPPRPTTIRRGAGGGRGQQQLPHPGGGGGLDVTVADQVPAAGLGALDVRHVTDTEHGRRHRLAERPGHRDRQQLAAERRVQHVHETGSAVGHRAQVDLALRGASLPAGRDRLRGLDGGEGAGEGVRGDETAHAAHPRRPGRGQCRRATMKDAEDAIAAVARTWFMRTHAPA